MPAHTTTNTSLARPAVSKKVGQRGRNAAGRRAVVVDGSLQVGDFHKRASGLNLKTSPSFSPAYLLAALEWADDGENRNGDDSDIGSASCSKPSGQAVRAAVLAQKPATSSNLRPRRANDDVNKVPTARPRPTAPRMGLLSEKLVFPSRKTPASFLPNPSSISLDTTAAVTPGFSSPSPISPGCQSLHREPHQQRQRQQQHQPAPQQHRTTQGRRQHHDQAEAPFSADDEVAQPAVETDRILLASNAEGEKTDGNQTMYQSMQPSAMSQPSTMSPSPPPQGHVREAFAFLTRGRKKSVTGDSPRATLTKRSRTLPVSSTSTSNSTGTEASEYTHSPATISSPDMPRGSMEALNPTVKSVGVRCRGTTVTVQVTKQTSTADLLRSCSHSLAKLGRPINPDTCVVIEPCQRPGLERRLRQYELVWHVVNTWDHDSSNSLIVLPDASDTDGELDLASVPKTEEEPEGFVLPLYFLQRPGKWVQRYITLKENGQMFASKKRDWKSSDKDVVRLCHLTDFDLYMPTEAEMRKQLRPPKRYCYAVKSQEKASLFLDLTHYVHFFCTEDPSAAHEFRSRVQGWRSWYLVNRKLRLHEKQELPSLSSRSQADYGSRGRASVDHGPRTRPSVDIPASPRSVSASRENTPTSPTAGTAIPPIPAFPAALREKKAAVFAAGGLLGNGYDERKQQAQQKEAAGRPRRGTLASTTNEGPFVPGPSLLNSRAGAAPTSDVRPQTSGSDGSYKTGSEPDSPQQASWFPSAVQHSAEQRSARPAGMPTRQPSTSSHAPSRTLSVRQRLETRHPPLPTTTTHHVHQPPLLPQQQIQQPQPQQQQPHHHRNGLPQQPLIDLTPTFVEPPQWSRENRGRGVRAPQGKPLVDLATGPPQTVPSTAARFLRDGAAPPKNLVRRPDQSVPVGSGGGTLMQMYEQQQLQQQQQRGGSRGRAGTVTDRGAMGMQMGMGMGGGSSGLARRNTVKSTTSGGGTSQRPGTAGGNGGATAAPVAYVQSRGRVMGVSEGVRDGVRERLRSVEVDGRYKQGQQGQGLGQLSLRGRREY